MDKTISRNFVFNDIDFCDVFTPEDFTEEHQMIAQTTEGFANRELIPNEERIAGLNYDLMKQLFRKAGEIGLLGADVPEEYGGLNLDKASSILITENLARQTVFGIAHGSQSGIGMLPLVFFGTKEQKEKYLPSLVSGEKFTAYALTEASAGSDAISIKTTAKLSEDGKYYVLNGTKQFITNAGYADYFVVYAKINGVNFSTFLVDRYAEGVSIGPEEKKMGLKGSSTCSLTFEDVKVPVENLIGEIGKGHLVALNVLNIGRFKLSALSLGKSKEALSYSIKYANERFQFNSSLSSFQLIGKKIAEMNTRIFVSESMIYRTVGLLDESLKEIDHSSPDVLKQSASAIAKFALEASINKVYGSEALGFVADEGVQIHGGYGYVQEYPIEQIYRDCRIFRIFEGTNEINRLLIPRVLIKKALTEEYNLIEKAKEFQSELGYHIPLHFDRVLEKETYLVGLAKKLTIISLAKSVHKYQKQLNDEQEVCGLLADNLITLYGMESALLRTRKIISKSGESKAQNAIRMTTLVVQEGFEKIINGVNEILSFIGTEDELQSKLQILTNSLNKELESTIKLKREIALKVIEAEKYVIN